MYDNSSLVNRLINFTSSAENPLIDPQHSLERYLYLLTTRACARARAAHLFPRDHSTFTLGFLGPYSQAIPVSPKLPLKHVYIYVYLILYSQLPQS